MPDIPQRLSLVRQTADILRAEIHKGTWKEWLPGERELTSSLQVSRNTVRAALKELAAVDLIKACHGAGYRILSSPHPRSRTSHSVGLLAPASLQTLRPHQAVWIDHLRAALIEKGLHLHLHQSGETSRAQSPSTLQKLIGQRAYACWVLALCPERIQRWFAQNNVPAVVAGSTLSEIDLPFVDLDHRSLCRHAAGLLLSFGHRRIAFLTRAPLYAGDLESESGFMEGARLSSHQDVQAQVIRHDGTSAGLVKTLRRLMLSARAPTALLVGDSYHYLTTSSLLTKLGLSIPEDISLISRDDDTFLAHLVPAPTRYTADPALYARRLFELILAVREQRSAPGLRLQPRLVKGESVRRIG